MALLLYFAVLLSFTAVVLLLTRKTRFFLIILSAACTYWLFMAAGSYHIFISRSSTAGIGFLFIPIYSLLPALIAAVGIMLTIQKSMWSKALGALVLVGLIPLGWMAWHSITETQQTNAKRDAQYQAQREAYLSYLKQFRKHRTDYTTDTLLTLIDTKTERAFFLALAAWEDTPDAVLHKLVDYEDGGVLLSLLRHARTPSAAIDKAVRLNQRHYFSRDLAANPTTPRDILISLVEGLSINIGIGRALAQNPNADCLILQQIADHAPASLTSYEKETRTMASRRLKAECS